MFYEFPSLAENIYTINIDVIEGDIENTIEDDRIGLTIIQIFKMFFIEVKNAIVYVCDGNDERHFARKRKFDFWFNKYNNGTILKEDGVAIVENTKNLNSLLISSKHPKSNEIILAFKAINKTAHQK